MLGLSVQHNIGLANHRRTSRWGLVDASRERGDARRMIDQLRIKTPGPDRITRWLSGGNQQKVVLAKWLAGHAEIFIFDEPTRGIDVAARRDIYDLMNTLVARGAGADHDLFGSPGSPRHERPDPRDAAGSDSSRIRREVGLGSRDHARGVWSGFVSEGRPGASRARQFGTLLGLLALSLALWILTPHFLTVSNLLNVLEQSSINAIVAAGMTFAIISGGIDLSVGSVLALSGIVLASLLQSGRGAAGRADARAGERRSLRPAERPLRDDGASAAVHRDPGDDERRTGPGADLGRRPADLGVRRIASV